MTNPTSPSPSSGASPRFLPLLLILFIGSGCAALVYEVVWLQMLTLVVGASGISLGVLLGTFMGGMCLGSLLLPKLVSKRFHPLQVYAALELGIGACGLLVLWGLPLLEQFYTKFGGEGLSGILLRGLVSGICLLPPTMLMGATLPAMSRWIQATPRGVSWLGFFYGGNTFGAVGGCLLAGFYLLRVHDMPYTTHIAVYINIAVALAALGLAALAPVEIVAADEQAAGNESASTGGARTIFVAIAISGLTALGAEVVWTRLLSLMFGATVYTFSLILAVFLTGLGIGSTAGATIAREAKVSPRVALGVCQLLLVAAIAWTSFAVSHSIPFWPIKADLYAVPRPWSTFQMDVACCFFAIFPATVLWGASFPLALAAAASGRGDPGKLVGDVYAANTVGAIFGALGFSLLIMPTMGSQGSQKILIALACVGALAAIVPELIAAPGESGAAGSRRTALTFATLAGLVLAVWLGSTVSRPYWGMVAYGRFAPTYASELIEGVDANGKGVPMLSAWPRDAQPIDPNTKEPLKVTEWPGGITAEKNVPQGDGTDDLYSEYVGEGMNVSVAVSMSTGGIRSFHGAGKVQASNDPQDMRLQRVLGHISMLAHKDPDSVKSVLVVACGAGVTAGSFIPYLAANPDLKITIVDIEPLVPTHVTPRFAKENYSVVGSFDDNGNLVPGPKNVTVIYDDGRHFLRTTKEKFDIITSDPIDPWVKGCAALNTVEYYQMAKDHLNPGGVMSLWIPLYESNIETAKSVLGTFFKVYPQGILWSNDIKGEGYDAVLWGRKEDVAPVINIDEMQARLDRPDYAEVKQSLADVNIHSAVDLLITFAGQAPNMGRWLADAQINNDRDLRLQYLAGMWLNSYMGRDILSDILKDYIFPGNIFTGSPEKVQALQTALNDEGRARFATMERLQNLLNPPTAAAAAPAATP